jgi:hypothetical protein
LHKILKSHSFFAQRRNGATGKNPFISRNDATAQRKKNLLSRATTQWRNEKELFIKKSGI